MVHIVSGTFEFDPERRDAFVLGTADMVRDSRAEEGCIDYAFNVDPIDPRLVRLFECWADDAALELHRTTAHMAGFRALMASIPPKGMTLADYVGTFVPRV
jgi:quinol monooxygenase YgiN